MITRDVATRKGDVMTRDRRYDNLSTTPKLHRIQRALGPPRKTRLTKTDSKTGWPEFASLKQNLFQQLEDNFVLIKRTNQINQATNVKTLDSFDFSNQYGEINTANDDT